MILSNYVRTLIYRMAAVTRTDLTEKHLKILTWVYEYYQKNRVGPLFLNIQKNLGVTKEEINALFPHGLNSIYTWVGIPIQTLETTCKPAAEVAVEHPRVVYLDNNATTMIRKEVADVLVEYYKGDCGYANPSSSSTEGQRAFQFIQDSREKIAAAFGVKDTEIFFTSCGSESLNFALKGAAFAEHRTGGHIISQKTEHKAVLNALSFLADRGFEVTLLDVNREGLIDPQAFAAAVKPETFLASIMMVNNEIGAIQPVEEIGKICKEKGILFCVDAVQAVGKIPVKPGVIGADLLAFSGHKIYAPKGIGAIYVREGIKLEPLVHGGGQESGLRSGTENVASIRALGLAVELAEKEREMQWRRVGGLQEYFLQSLRKIESGFIINGTMRNRSAYNLNIGFPGADTGALLLSLGKIGVSASAGSACSSGRFETSHVLKAIGADDRNFGSLRFSFSRFTSQEDLDYVLRYLPSILEQIQEKRN